MENIKDLERKITEAQNAYYNGENAIMSDAEFDSLWDRLTELDPTNAILHKVGKDSGSAFEKIEHLIHMNSQKKSTNAEEFREWARDQEQKEFVVQNKCDGSSIELQYKTGEFIRAVTRGNGVIGDDVTCNIKEIQNFPKKLKDSAFSGAVRGEVVLFHETFDTYFKDKANCRNAANGIMKRKNSAEAKYLSIIVYDVMRIGEPQFLTETSKIQWLHDNGFDVVDSKKFPSSKIEDIINLRDKLTDSRFATVKYDIDGLVIKCNKVDYDDQLKDRPDHQIAFKFSLTEQPTFVRDVEWCTNGKTRTPVAITDPVYLCGTTVKRANICNLGLIRTMGLKIGSKVMMVKRGEIIPKIERLLDNPPGCIPIRFPEICESCGSRLVVSDTQLYCPNKKCPNTLIHRLTKWASINKIYGLGESIARSLMDVAGVDSVKKLYTVSEKDIALAVGSEKIASKLKENIDRAKNISLTKFIAGFDLDEIGEITVRNVWKATNKKTLDAFLSITEGELRRYSGFSDISAENICSQFSEYKMELLELAGIVGVKMPEVKGGNMGGVSWLCYKHIAFTGELETMTRKQAEEILEDAGGKVDKKVTSKTDFVVAAKPSSSSKYKDAKSKGIPIIDEQEFLKMIKGTY